MANLSNETKSKLHTILVKDYEECQFFFAAASLLMEKLKHVQELTEKEEVEFTVLRDAIGEIGIYINSVEKGIDEIEECYTKLVEALDR